jgi:hypothetical protein
MLARWLQMLTDREKIHACGAPVVDHQQHFVTLLTESHHGSRFCEQLRINFLHALKKANGMEAACDTPNIRVMGWHRFEIMAENIRSGCHDLIQRVLLRTKSGVSISKIVFGKVFRINEIVRVKRWAPPSNRSS